MHLSPQLNQFAEAFAKLPQLKIIKAIGLLLLIYIAYLCAQITWLILTPTENSGSHVFVNSNVSVSGNEVKKVSIDELLSLNLFGQYSETPQEEVIEIKDAPQTRLRLVLSATVASDSKETAAAVIENKGVQETYGIGDKITGTRATLAQVLPDRVLIKVSGKMETLMLDGFSYNKKVVLPPSNNIVRPAPKRPSPSQKQNNANVVDQRKNKALSKEAARFKADLTSNPGKITDYLSVSRRREEGKIIGYQLRPGRDATFFKSSGLRSGDVAIQMNGYDLTSPSEAAQALQAIKEETEVSLLIIRNEDITEILFSIGN